MVKEMVVGGVETETDCSSGDGHQPLVNWSTSCGIHHCIAYGRCMPQDVNLSDEIDET